jgi:Na+/proline symporter
VVVAKGVSVSSVIDVGTIVSWPVFGELVIPAKATGIIICFGVAAAYTTIAGLWGVMATDFFQFFFAMTATVILMAFVLGAAGGPTSMVEQATEAVESGIVQNRTAVNRHTLTGQDAYTFSKSVLTDNATRKKLLDGGVISEHQPTNGEAPVSLYRFAEIDWTEAELLERIREAGVEDAGEIMAAWRNDRVVSSSKITSFLPPFDLEAGFLAVWAFVVFISLQWWAGGAGDGFLAQRIFSCKDERHSVLAMLWYNFAMFVLRPWPWIVVGIASLFLVPDVTEYGAHYDQEHAYVIMLMKYLPVGLKGLMVAALMAAYMSTISTHVNFGASYVVNDLYKRFVQPTGSEKTLVRVSQIASLFLALIAGIWAFYAKSVGDQWFIYFEMMSGAGIVIPLRWYWWRINAWTEISAMVSSLMIFSLMRATTVFHSLFETLGMPEFWLEEYAVRFTVNLVLTALVWLSVTYLTGPEPTEHLLKFYRRVRPAGAWGPIPDLAGNPDHLTVGWREWFAWVLGVTGLFSMIFALGHACFGNIAHSGGFAVYSLVATVLLFMQIGKMDWTSIETELE